MTEFIFDFIGRGEKDIPVIEKDDLDAWSDRWVDMRERIIIEDAIREAARAGRKIRVTIEEIISCPKCGASATKFGKPAGRQRYRCMAHGCHHIFMEQR